MNKVILSLVALVVALASFAPAAHAFSVKAPVMQEDHGDDHHDEEHDEEHHEEEAAH